MLPPPPVQAFEPSEPEPRHQPDSPSSLSSGYSSIPPTSTQDYPFLLPEPVILADILDTEASYSFSNNSQVRLNEPVQCLNCNTVIMSVSEYLTYFK